MIKHLIFLFYYLFFSFAFFEVADANELKATIQSARAALVTEVRQNELGQQFWHMPSYYGQRVFSEYLLLSRWLNHETPRLETDKFRQELFRTQKADGSWIGVNDINRSSGDIDPTITNYFALKALGTPSTDPRMLMARSFIMNVGGLTKATFTTKILLALFGNYPWAEIPKIADLFFSSWSPINADDFAVWVKDTMVAVSYLRRFEVVRNLGEDFSLKELHSVEIASDLAEESSFRDANLSRDDGKKLIGMLLEAQQPLGNWGFSAISTLIAAAALSDHAQHDKEDQSRIQIANNLGIKRIEDLLFSPHRAAESYGIDHESVNWDTSLSLMALHQSLSVIGPTAASQDLAAMANASDYLASHQHSSGGFYFGEDFSNTPDCDDTAMAIMALAPYGEKYSGVINKAVRFLVSMQNSDGGWAAFSKDRSGNFVLRYFLNGIVSTDFIYDMSSADVTGHVLEALSHLEASAKPVDAIKNGIGFLEKSQSKDVHGWQGRWGNNYLYGTSSAILGLISNGESPSSEYIKKSLNWLLTVQNEDGGFGESTLSYGDSRMAGKGLSTPTQTAWGLQALAQGGRSYEFAAHKAANYLVKTFKGRWHEEHVNGTGIPGSVYSIYPVYPYTFPLMALSKYTQNLKTAEKK